MYLLFLAVLGLGCCVGFSLVAVSRGYSLVVEHGLLIAVASLLLRNVFSRACRLQQLWHTGSVVVAQGLSCSTAHGLFPNQGSNPYLLLGQAESLSLSHQGSLRGRFLIRLIPNNYHFTLLNVKYFLRNGRISQLYC